MKINEAIEVFERELEDTFIGSEEKWKRAIRLGIEALRRTQAAKVSLTCLCNQPLLSETKD